MIEAQTAKRETHRDSARSATPMLSLPQRAYRQVRAFQWAQGLICEAPAPTYIVGANSQNSPKSSGSTRPPLGVSLPHRLLSRDRGALSWCQRCGLSLGCDALPPSAKAGLLLDRRLVKRDFDHVPGFLALRSHHGRVPVNRASWGVAGCSANSPASTLARNSSTDMSNNRRISLARYACVSSRVRWRDSRTASSTDIPPHSPLAGFRPVPGGTLARP